MLWIKPTLLTHWLRSNKIVPTISSESIFVAVECCRQDNSQDGFYSVEYPYRYSSLMFSSSHCLVPYFSLINLTIYLCTWYLGMSELFYLLSSRKGPHICIIISVLIRLVNITVNALILSLGIQLFVDLLVFKN